MEIIFPKPENYYIEKHNKIDIWKEDVILLWGGRFGAKSETLARYLIKKSLKKKEFRCVLARKVRDTVKDSNYEQIKSFVESNNLSQVFKFRKNPLEIECINGNIFITRGFDKAEKIKGIKSPTDFWIEEAAEISQQDFETALTTIRSDKTNAQLYLTFNPETKEDINDFWLYTMYFKGRESFDFIDKFTFEVDGKKINFSIRSVHTTYHDNKFTPPNQIAILHNYKRLYETTKSQIAKYYYMVWTLGEWGNKIPENNYLHSFSELLNVKSVEFNEDYPLHISFDKNINPYQPASIFQYIDNIFYQLFEFAPEHPNNRIRKLIEIICKKLKDIRYIGRIYVYGDATAKAQDSTTEEGTHFYTIIKSEFKKYGYSTEIRVPGVRDNLNIDQLRKHKNPNSQDAGEFINYLLKKQKIFIDSECHKSINDYINAPTDNNGGISKKEKDIKTGGDKWGHFTDILKYFICEFLYIEFMEFSENKTVFVS